MRSSCTRDQICAPTLAGRFSTTGLPAKAFTEAFDSVFHCLMQTSPNHPKCVSGISQDPQVPDSWVFAKVLILQCASQFTRSPLPYFTFSPPWSSVLRLHPHINCRALPSTWYLGLTIPSRHSPFPLLADPALPWPNSAGTWPYLFACWPGLEVGLGPEGGVCAASKHWDLCIVLSKWKVPALDKEEWPLLLAQDVQGPLGIQDGQV